MKPQYLFDPRKNGLAIVHVATICEVGYVDFRGAEYRVRNVGGHEIGIVKSIEHAIPTLLDYCHENPPQWELQGATAASGFIKDLPFAWLRVERDKLGPWFAYRNGRALMRNDNPATFATAEEAQRAAESHLLDGYPNSKEVVADGLWWLPDPLFEAWLSPSTDC